MASMTVMCFGFDTESMSLLRCVCRTCALNPPMEIQPHQYHLPLADIMRGESGDARAHVSQRLLLFDTTEHTMVNSFIHHYREKNMPSAIMAVLKDTRRDWRFSDYLSELMEERDQFARMAQRYK